MKSILYIGIVLIITVSFISCEKTVYNRVAVGHIIDVTTNKPITGAYVDFYIGESEFLGKTKLSKLDSAITSVDGKFEFKYRKMRKQSIEGGKYVYLIYGSAPNYFYDPTYIYIGGADGADQKNLQIKLIPQAELVFDVRNTSGGNYLLFGTNHTRTNQIDNHASQGTFKRFPVIVEGNRQIKVNYEITQTSGNKEEHDTTIYCPAFKSTNFIIEF